MRRIIFSRLNYNKYTNGSGVGAVSNSNRAALKRRASKTCCSNSNTTSGTRYVKVFFRGTDGIIQISQLAVYSNGINVARNGTASAANSLGYDSFITNPIDGTLSVRNFPDIYHSYEPSGLNEPSGFGYWLLDLGGAFDINQIVYYNRNGYQERANGMIIETYDSNYPNNSVPLKTFVLNSDFIQTFNL